MGNLGWGEMLVLGFLALIILGPERLPKYAAEAGRVLRQLREMAKDASSELRADLGPEMADINLADLANPKRMVARYLLEGDDDRAGVGAVSADGVPAARRPNGPPLAAGEAPPYDADAT